MGTYSITATTFAGADQKDLETLISDAIEEEHRENGYSSSFYSGAPEIVSGVVCADELYRVVDHRDSLGRGSRHVAARVYADEDLVASTRKVTIPLSQEPGERYVTNLPEVERWVKDNVSGHVLSVDPVISDKDVAPGVTATVKVHKADAPRGVHLLAREQRPAVRKRRGGRLAHRGDGRRQGHGRRPPRTPGARRQGDDDRCLLRGRVRGRQGPRRGHHGPPPQGRQAVRLGGRPVLPLLKSARGNGGSH